MITNRLFFPLFVITSTLAVLQSVAQDKSDSGTQKFSSVMNIPQRISGNFGEMRSGHFHSGIDYKTNERIGYEVFAAADGYVSRVKISAGGFGKAIYLNHPDGVTTVYAHLRAFYPALDDSISKLQYSKKEFEIEMFPSRDMFPVKRGQLIGYAGNSGSSEGPHLHFETRQTASEKPFNPETVGYNITDIIPPVISSLVLYRPGPAGALFGSTRKIFPVMAGKGPVSIITDTLLTGNEFFLGFEAYDKAGTEQNILGIRSFQLFLNDAPVYSYRIDQFSFDETRMVNAVIDYPFKVETGRTIILCKKLPGNKLAFVGPFSGIHQLKDNEILQGKIRVEDQNRNYSEVLFVIKNVPGTFTSLSSPKGLKVKHGEQKNISDHFYQVQFQKNSLYEDSWIEHSYSPASSSNQWSGILAIHPPGLAIHEAINLQLKPSRNVRGFENKLVIVGIDGKGKEQYLGGEFSDGWVKASSRSLGKFLLKIDTMPPVAGNPQWKTDELTSLAKIQITVSDNLSGIKNYRILLNGSWVVGEYNSRYNYILIYPRHLPSVITRFELTIELEDRTGNKANYQFTLNR